MLRSFTKLANDMYFAYPYSNEEINKIRNEFLVVLSRSVDEKTYNNFVSTEDPKVLIPMGIDVYDAASIVFGMM